MKDLVSEYIKPEKQSNHRRRGVLDFVGEISNILFGTLMQSDARVYNKHLVN